MSHSSAKEPVEGHSWGKSGGEVWDLQDDKLDAFVASEYESWTKLIREAGIKLD
jgi:hypothetical protein